MNSFDKRPAPACIRLALLRRPKLLMRAVASALKDCPHPNLLKRLGVQNLPPSQRVDRLFALEEQLEQNRRLKSALYRPARHIETLTALCAEIAKPQEGLVLGQKEQIRPANQ